MNLDYMTLDDFKASEQPEIIARGASAGALGISEPFYHVFTFTHDDEGRSYYFSIEGNRGRIEYLTGYRPSLGGAHLDGTELKVEIDAKMSYLTISEDNRLILSANLRVPDVTVTGWTMLLMAIVEENTVVVEEYKEVWLEALVPCLEVLSTCLTGLLQIGSVVCYPYLRHTLVD